MSYWGTLLTSRGPAPEIRLFGLGETLIGRWRRVFDAHLAAVTAARRGVAAAALATGVAQEVAGWITAAALLWLALAGAIDVGTLVALLYALGSVRTAIRRLVFSLGELTRYGADFSYLRRLTHAEPGSDTPRAALAPPAPLQSRIEFRDVGFTYPGAARPALAGVNLILRPGERIALVGENGAGKTTLVRLLLGLYRPTEGTVAVDGVDLAALEPAAWHETATAVFQDFMRYQTTVAENVAYGDATLLHEGAELVNHLRLVAASTRSGADDFVRHLPDGYATALGRPFGGVELSTGQWQRLAIARAYLRPAEILVLDEPAAALDAKAEAAVYEHFARMAAGRTVLLISHRLGSCRIAGRILVLRDGRLVEDGSHDSLLATGGEYADLYRQQAAWYC